MTTKLHPAYYLPLWEQAEANEIGLLIEVVPDDRVLLVNALYECKKLVDRFDSLIIFQPRDNTVYLAHKTVELPP